MHKALFTAALLASALSLPLAAHADTLDLFTITGTPDPLFGGPSTMTFTLPASPDAIESIGAGGVDGGFFIPGTFPVTIDGQASTASFDFLSANLLFIGPGLTISAPSLGNFTLVGALLYDGSSSDPTFKTGTFNLREFIGSGTNPYTLTITPETADAPEPSTLILLGTGTLSLIGFAAWRKRTLHSSIASFQDPA
jgi:hypothetical protein